MRSCLLSLLVVLVCSRSTPDKSRIRVVSLAPSLTEIVFALRRGEDLVGVTTLCDYPAQAATKPKVGDFSNQSLERIVLTKPDIVLVNLPEHARIKNELDKLNIKTYNSSPSSIEDIFSDIRAIGEILHTTARAESLIDSLRCELSLIAPATPDSPGVYLEISPRPLVTVGGKTYINEAIVRAGGVNIFRDITAAYPVVSQEELIRRDPAIVFILHNEKIGNRLGWNKVSAIQRHRIYYDLNPDLIFRPGPRIVQGIKAMHLRISQRQ